MEMRCVQRAVVRVQRTIAWRRWKCAAYDELLSACNGPSSAYNGTLSAYNGPLSAYNGNAPRTTEHCLHATYRRLSTTYRRLRTTEHCPRTTERCRETAERRCVRRSVVGGRRDSSAYGEGLSRDDGSNWEERKRQRGDATSERASQDDYRSGLAGISRAAGAGGGMVVGFQRPRQTLQVAQDHPCVPRLSRHDCFSFSSPLRALSGLAVSLVCSPVTLCPCA
jgi:hypothetical protein